jgi:hypothetical protein
LDLEDFCRSLNVLGCLSLSCLHKLVHFKHTLLHGFVAPTWQTHVNNTALVQAPF